MQKCVGLALAGATALVALAAGCMVGPGSSGSFERTLTVTGPVRLELATGSGSVEVRAGNPRQVRLHGEVRVYGWLWEDAQRKLQEITSNPPIEQNGNLIRVGHEKFRLQNVAISYAVVAPVDTELQTRTGSGHLDARGIRGPAKLTTGSGGIFAGNIREDTQATTGSGGVELSEIRGSVRATAGSGAITLDRVGGDIRALAGSGGITISQPGGRITAKTGSGGVTISGAEDDISAMAGSGGLTIRGNPAPNSYWELRTGSGGVVIGVPADASFRLHAHSHSGSIDTDIPIVIEERSRRELRARVGSGAARVDVETGSGNIRIH